VSNYLHIRIIFVIVALFILSANTVYADDGKADEAPASTSRLDADVQSVKKEALDVNRELFMIEEDILYPDSTQVTVFLSLDVGNFFDLDSVQLRIDDKIVANYLYTQREVTALKKGGVQQLYQGNLKNGDHELTAYFIGKGPHNRDYKRGVTQTVSKELTPLNVELKIVDNASSEQPDFNLAVWDK
jgi:hypothetical protein